MPTFASAGEPATQQKMQIAQNMFRHTKIIFAILDLFLPLPLFNSTNDEIVISVRLKYQVYSRTIYYSSLYRT
jgi:hypothetical protein